MIYVLIFIYSVLEVVLGTIFRIVARITYILFLLKDKPSIMLWEYCDGKVYEEPTFPSRNPIKYAGTKYVYKYPWDYALKNKRYISKTPYGSDCYYQIF